MSQPLTFRQRYHNACGLFRQIMKKTWWLWILLVLCLLPYIDIGCPDLKWLAEQSWYKMVCPTILLGLFWFICANLTDYFSLLKKETAITWSQIIILILIGAWIAWFICTFDFSKNDNSALVFGIASALMAWIFQDKVKGAVAFIHLRINHLLYIDDWIQVPKYNVDGEVKRITLTTVTVYNWDTTTSTIPTSALQSDHFINLQQMTKGKTYGREMIKSFILDTDHFHSISEEEAKFLKQHDEITKYLPEEDIHAGVLNAQLYRLYLYHWLMNNPHISQLPRLYVRWLEYREDGLPLQINAFIMEGEVVAFEWQQSQIIEHVVESMNWFGLHLYQTLSSNDVRNQLFQFAEKVVNGRKEAEQ